jgi:hypothetical protein
VKWAIDPALDGDPYADKPYMYSPGLASWNYFRIGEKVDPEKTDMTLNLHGEMVEEGADGSGAEVRKSLQIPDDPGARKKYFLDEEARKKFVFEEGRIYFVDFGNPYLGFNGDFFAHPNGHQCSLGTNQYDEWQISPCVSLVSIFKLPSILMRRITSCDIR